MKRLITWSVMLLAWIGRTATVEGGLGFTPAAGYTAETVWSGADAAHFAVDGDRYFIYGTERSGGLAHNVVRMFDGAGVVEVGRSPAFTGSLYSPDAITAVNGDVYWASVRNFSDAQLFRSSYVGGSWITTAALDEAAGINVYSLSTDGDHVFGVGLDAGGTNVAFYLDDAGEYNVLAELPGLGSGGSGFDPDGNFFAASFGDDLLAHMYAFSAAQVADRLDGTQAAPYSIADALADHIVPSNASAVMESDGYRVFGSVFNPSFTGSDPYAFELATGQWATLGDLEGADTAITTDLYYRGGGVVFMGKDDFGTGGTAAIYHVVPEPTALALLMLGGLIQATWGRRARTRGQRSCHMVTFSVHGGGTR